MESEKMAVDEVLCMKGGTDQTSYASNSFLQKTVIGKVGALVEESIKALCTSGNLGCLSMADLGCSSGPNTLSVVQSVLDVAVSTCQGSGQRAPELNVFLNDLPQNDFNTVFTTLRSFYKKIAEEKGTEISCFVSGTPGSFYGRLFPTNFLHFVHSSYSLHWLSQVPEGLVGEKGEALNKGCLYGSKESPNKVLQAYTRQFSEDFTLFLKSRSEEVVNGGRMVLSLSATHESEVMGVMHAYSQAFSELASKGLIDKEKLDAFNLPFYRPTTEHVKQLIEDEGSFAVHKLGIFSLPWISISHGSAGNNDGKDVDHSKIARFVIKTTRAVYESLFASEFGEQIMDDLFGLAQGFLTEILSAHSDTMGIFTLVVSLVKRNGDPVN